MQYRFCYGTIENHLNQEDTLKDIFSLRYQVYVNECQFETPVDHPFGLEKDKFDKYAIHYFARDKSEYKVIATARMILDSDLGFPIENLFDITQWLPGVEKKRIGEISRLAVSKHYRKRAIDNAIFGSGTYDPRHIPRYVDQGRDLRRQCEHELIRGLYLRIYRDSKRNKVDFWVAIMSKGLYIILKRWGIPFVQMGPEIYHHGIRAPYLASIKAVEQSLEKVNSELLKEARQDCMQ